MVNLVKLVFYGVQFLKRKLNLECCGLAEKKNYKTQFLLMTNKIVYKALSL